MRGTTISEAGRRRRWHRIAAWLAPLLLAAVIVAAPGPSAWPASPKVTMLWVAISGSQSPVWITKEGGYFTRNGVDVNLQYLVGSPVAAAALASGRVDFVEMAGPAVVAADAAGHHLVMVMGFVNQPAFVLMVSPEIQTPEQLKGKTIAVVKVGSSDDFMLREALSHWRLRPGTDVQITGVNSVGGQIAAMEKHLVQAVVVDPPNDFLLQRAGAHVLVRIRDLGIAYQAAGLVTTREYIKAHPDVVARVVRAMTEGVHRFKTDRIFAEQVMATYLKNDDPVVVDDAYQAYADIFQPAPAPTKAGLQEIIRQMTSEGRLKHSIDVETLVDTSFVDRLQASGFIEQLYKAGH